MDRRVSATAARIRFGELMRDVVEKQEAVVVEQNGEPHVVLISVDEYNRLVTAQRDRLDWRDLVAEAREQVHADLGGREMPPSEEILRQIREERNERLASQR